MRHGDRTLGRARLALLAVLPSALLAGCGGAGGAEEGGASLSEHTLITPDAAGLWTRVATDAAQENAKAYLARAKEESQPGATPLFAEYERPDGATLAFLGFNVDPESPLGERLADTPEVVADVTLADAGIEDRQAVDAGELGGAIACGTLPKEYQVDGMTCAWADDTSFAQVTVVVRGLNYDRAAQLTREFRDAVTTR